MASMTNPPNEPERQPEEDPGSRPTEVSKPIGDAIPAPVEPGLDQPLPRKGETAPVDDSAPDGTDSNIPAPGKSDFA